MALDSLKWKQASDFTHKPEHDLESLFYVILHLCTYTAGPALLRSHIPGSQEQSICLNEWSNLFDRHQLVRCKASQLDLFQDFVLERLPSYWDDFHPVLLGLRNILWGKESPILSQSNIATHDGFLRVLMEAREKFRDSNEEVRPFAPLKAPIPSQKRKDSDKCPDEGAQRGKKAARAEDNKRVTISWAEPAPHNINPQRFSSYIDSGAPSASVTPP